MIERNAMKEESKTYKMDLREIVLRLTGPINPVGETNEDDRRYGNLKWLCVLVSMLVDDIERISAKKSRVEYSIKRAGEFADEFLKKDLGITE